MVQSQTASVSMIQRRLRVGYTRAGRLIDMLERRGIISGYEGSKPRQVLVSEAELPRMLERLSARAAAGRMPRPDEPDPRRAEPEPRPDGPSSSQLSSSWRPPPGRRGAARAARMCAVMATRDEGRRAADRRGPEAGAHPPQGRHPHGRAADEDPDQVPAGARERGVGRASRARLREGLPAHLRAVPRPRRRRARRRVPPHGRERRWAPTAPIQFSEPVLERRRRPGEEPRRRWPVQAVRSLGARGGGRRGAVLVVLGAGGSDERKQRHHHKGKHHAHHHGNGGSANQRRRLHASRSRWRWSRATTWRSAW